MAENLNPVADDRQNDPISQITADAVLRVRYRIRFAKTGLLRWIGHQDLAQLWERLLRRAELKLSMTEGFHPKPRIAFPSALALGVDGLDEVVELELAMPLSPTELLDRLVSDNQPGLRINSAKRLPEGFGKAQLSRTDYRITPPDEVDLSRVADPIQMLLSKETVSIDRKKKTVTLKVAEQISRLEVVDNAIELSLVASQTASMRVDDVLNLLGLDDWLDRGARITRTKVCLEKEFETDDLDEIAINTVAINAIEIGAATSLALTHE